MRPLDHVSIAVRDLTAAKPFYRAVRSTAGIAAGGTCNGRPGLRPHDHAHGFGAFPGDPEGNVLGVVAHGCDDSASGGRRLAATCGARFRGGTPARR